MGKNTKSRVRKIDASNIVEKHIEKTNTSESKNLFFLDTKGSTQGIAKSARRALILEKRRQELNSKNKKSTPKLSSSEIEKVEKLKLSKIRREAEPEKHKAKEIFDLWDMSEVKDNIMGKSGTKIGGGEQIKAKDVDPTTSLKVLDIYIFSLYNLY